MSPDHHRSLILNALPRPLPRGAVVADVVLASSDERGLYQSGITAKVRRLFQGPRGTRQLIVKPTIASSCDAPFENGASGLIVGKPVARHGGVLVIEPLLVPKRSGYRLRDGYQFPPDFPRDSR